MSKTEYQPEIFDFEKPFVETEWLVQDIIPAGHLCILIAQSGAGKSFILEWLAIAVTFGIQFGDFKTIEGDVLLIDQDTPTDVLNKRLIRMGRAIGGKPKYDLRVYSMRDLSLSNGSLVYIVKNSDARLTIIDSLHSVCGNMNTNKTTDMSPKLVILKSECLTKEKTILVAHHITEKITLTLNQFMDGNSHISGMGNSAIRQQADTEYILTSTVADGKIDKLYLRPVAKRAAVSQKPIIMNLLEPDDNSMSLQFAGYYTPDMDEAEQDIYLMINSFPKDYTVKEIVDFIGQKYTVLEIREALISLEVKKKLVMSRAKHNMFKYRLP